MGAGSPEDGIFDRDRSLDPERAAEIRAYFNRAAEDEEHYPSTIDPRIWHVKLVLEHLEACMAPGKRVADIGCGKGRYARVVKERWPSAHVDRGGFWRKRCWPAFRPISSASPPA